MRPPMKRTFLALPVLLAACSGSPTTMTSPSLPTSPGVTNSSSAQVQALQSVSSAATIASQVGAAMGNPGVASTGATVAAAADTLTQTASVIWPSAGPFTYVDLYVNTGDPVGMRALVPYLMKPGVWMLIQVDNLSTASKHYRFQKVTTGGPQMPEVDVFKTGH